MVHDLLTKISPIQYTGTFWYHSHLSTQYCDGLRGALVVYDSEDPHAVLYDVDDGKYPERPHSMMTQH